MTLHLAMDFIGSRDTGSMIVLFVMLVMLSFTCISYFCNRARLLDSAAPTHIDQEAALGSLPKLPYSRVKDDMHASPSYSDSCSVCLGEYEEDDVIRLLPDCGHWFHAKCVDLWIKAHPTCPVCRTPPVLVPFSAPRAEATLQVDGH